jgi:hypothetical protein
VCVPPQSTSPALLERVAKALTQRLAALAPAVDAAADDGAEGAPQGDEVGDEEDALLRSLAQALGLALQRLLWHPAGVEAVEAAKRLARGVCASYALPSALGGAAAVDVSDAHLVASRPAASTATRVARVYVACVALLRLQSDAWPLDAPLRDWLLGALSPAALAAPQTTPSATLKIALVRYVSRVSRPVSCVPPCVVCVSC